MVRNYTEIRISGLGDCTLVMTTTTLLEYLTQPNPVLDCSKSPTGTNTVNARWDRVTGLQDWAEFNYETLMQSYGHILSEQVPPLPETTPPLTRVKQNPNFADLQLRLFVQPRKDPPTSSLCLPTGR
jgi:hypothetical protein